MTERRIRLHDSPDHDASIIGFGLGIESAARAALQEFLHERGYETRSFNGWDAESSQQDKATISVLGALSLRYLEVRPPIRNEDLTEFARHCVEHARPSTDTGVLLDDRISHEPYDGRERARILARW